MNFTFSFVICGQAGSPYSRDLARICHRTGILSCALLTPVSLGPVESPCSVACDSSHSHTEAPKRKGAEADVKKTRSIFFILDDKRRKVKKVAPIQGSTCRECGTIIWYQRRDERRPRGGRDKATDRRWRVSRRLARVPSFWVSDPVLSPSPSLR